ncbi:MAG: 6-phosphofructokinase [Bacillota bacterium]|nr:6-phosphofructokinase [Bacillota bacterium]
MKRIMILTSGGDAPGMNAAIRACVRIAIYNNLEVLGVNRGYAGLMQGDVQALNLRSVGDIIDRGGTVLQTSRSKEFTEEKGFAKALESIKKLAADGLVVIGGDGSFRGAEKLSKAGIRTVGIPATIDNDLEYTDSTIGYDTALNTVLTAIGNLRDTSSSHKRVSIIEVMGRHCGDIAIFSGLAGGADGILIPELDRDMDLLCEKIVAGNERGKQHHIIIVAEGAMSAYDCANYINLKLNLSTTVTVIGHLQRGGSPTVFDRNLAARFSYHAINTLLEGRSSRVVGLDGKEIFDMDISEALSMTKTVDEEAVKLAEILSL